VNVSIQLQAAVKFSLTFTRSTLLSYLGFGVHPFSQLCSVVNFTIHCQGVFGAVGFPELKRNAFLSKTYAGAGIP